MIRTPRGFLMFEPDRLPRLPDYLDREDLDGADLASTIRAIASSRSSSLSIRKIMWRMPNGLAYINVGHTNLNSQTFRAMMEMPDNRKIVMIHDTIPIDHPEYQTEASRAKFVERLTATINFANHIIVPSDEVRENIEKRMVGTGHRVPVHGCAAWNRYRRAAARWSNGRQALFRRSGYDRAAQEPPASSGYLGPDAPQDGRKPHPRACASSARVAGRTRRSSTGWIIRPIWGGRCSSWVRCPTRK